MSLSSGNEAPRDFQGLWARWKTAPGTSVESAAGQYTVVRVDVPMAENHLQAALQALNESDLRTANANLAAVQKGVTMVMVAADLPLLRARQNLALASAAVKSGN